MLCLNTTLKRSWVAVLFLVCKGKQKDIACLLSPSYFFLAELSFIYANCGSVCVMWEGKWKKTSKELDGTKLWLEGTLLL